MSALLPLLEGVEKPVLSCTRSGIEYLKESLKILQKVAGSPKKNIPTSTAPTAPIPVQTG